MEGRPYRTIGGDGPVTVWSICPYACIPLANPASPRLDVQLSGAISNTEERLLIFRRGCGGQQINAVESASRQCKRLPSGGNSVRCAGFGCRKLKLDRTVINLSRKHLGRHRVSLPVDTAVFDLRIVVAGNSMIVAQTDDLRMWSDKRNLRQCEAY